MTYAKKVSNERLALHAIKPQFPDWPESQLMFAVIKQAVIDLSNKYEHDKAVRYLNGDMMQAEMCGIEPRWIRETLIKCGVKL